MASHECCTEGTGSRCPGNPGAALILLLSAQELLLSAQELLLSAQELLLSAQELLLSAQELLLSAQELLCQARSCSVTPGVAERLRHPRSC